MPFFIVMCKPIKGNFISIKTTPLNAEDLLRDIKTFSTVYLFESFELALNVANNFFSTPQVPCYGGTYGLIVEVEADTRNSVRQNIEMSVIYNSQKLAEKKELPNIISCKPTLPRNIKRVLNARIPPAAKAYNLDLTDTTFSEPYNCLVM